jgi:hypothetical protein
LRRMRRRLRRLLIPLMVIHSDCIRSETNKNAESAGVL